MANATIVALASLVVLAILFLIEVLAHLREYLMAHRRKADKTGELQEQKPRHTCGASSPARQSGFAPMLYLKSCHPRTFGKIMRHEKV